MLPSGLRFRTPTALKQKYINYFIAFFIRALNAYNRGRQPCLCLSVLLWWYAWSCCKQIAHLGKRIRLTWTEQSVPGSLWDPRYKALRIWGFKLNFLSCPRLYRRCWFILCVATATLWIYLLCLRAYMMTNYRTICTTIHYKLETHNEESIRRENIFLFVLISFCSLSLPKKQA